jgi:murein DD-endopeptidase MepM/ murein hydrolase activator NlpD
VKIGCTHASHGSQFGFDCGGHHSRWALDVVAGTGTPVHAVRGGFATDGTGRGGGSGYGNVVRIDHGDGVETLYAHLSEVLVPAEGTWVDETTVIGLVGSTGSSSTPHLHYEERVADEAVDPGPLAACHLGFQVAYPQVAGHDTWQGLPWGAFAMSSEGTACAAPPAPAAATPVRRIADGLEASLPTGDLLLAIASVHIAALG